MDIFNRFFESVPDNLGDLSPLFSDYLKHFWIPGMMPVQLLIVFFITILVFIIINYSLSQFGRRINGFWQAVSIWLTSIFILKYLIFPKLPHHLFYTYISVVTLAIFLYFSTMDHLWKEFRTPILLILSAKTPYYSKLRIGLFTIVPVVVWFNVTYAMFPRIQEPIELRTVGPAPPASIEVQGTEIFLQEVKSPYRVDEKGKYDERVEDRYLKANPFDDCARYQLMGPDFELIG